MAILCMESGGTKLVAALADRQAHLTSIVKGYRRAGQHAQDTLGQLIEKGRQLLKNGESLQAVSFGFGGIVQRSEQRPYVCFHEQGWDCMDSVQILEEAFQVPVFVENDCKLAALGEAHRGVGLLEGTLFYATLGTGIGGGIVRHGQLLQLGEFGEAEIGHTVVEEEGPDCSCGNRGCLETLCSGPGLENLAQRLAGLKTDARSLMVAFGNQDEVATAIVEQAAVYLGRIFASTINLLQPDLIVLGGGLMQSNEPFLKTIRAKTNPRVFPLFRGKTRFALSQLKEQAVCQGAAIYASQQLAGK